MKRFCIVLFPLLMCLSRTHAQPNTTPWQLTIRATHGADPVQERVFGVAEGASEAFDNGVDDLSPPAPPGWYTFFYIPSFPYSLIKDIRSNTTVFRSLAEGNTWLFHIDVSEETDTVLSWDTSHYPLGTQDPGVLEIRDSTGVVVADMLNASTVTISGDGEWNLYYVIPQGTAAVEDEALLTPDKFTLHPNFPNPFNGETVLRFEVRRSARLRGTVYDVKGGVVADLMDGFIQPGVHTLRWDGRDDDGARRPTGVYLFRLSDGSRVRTRRILMIE